MVNLRLKFACLMNLRKFFRRRRRRRGIVTLVSMPMLHNVSIVNKIDIAEIFVSISISLQIFFARRVLASRSTWLDVGIPIGTDHNG